MKKTTDIRAWKAPQWHQDWGDMQRELNLLKKLALAIEKLVLPYSCTLDTEVTGYMHIRLHSAGEEIGTIHIVDPVIDRYGCFLEIAGFPDADEFYTTEIQDITDLLCGKNTDKIYKKIAQSRQEAEKHKGQVAYGDDGLAEMQAIINKRVAQGGGYEAMHAGEKAIFFEDGNVIYLFRPDGEFVTVLSNTNGNKH